MVNFEFIGRRKIWYCISLAMIVISIVSVCTLGLNKGIDFTGGNIIQVKFDEATDVSTVRDVVLKYTTQTPSIQQSGDNEFLIRTSLLEENENEAIVSDLETTIGPMTVLRNDRIGAVIGSELLANALKALLIAMALMLVYITIRFKFNFAVPAIICLVHDVVCMVGVFSLFQLEIDSTFVAAILTIIGYSINNTIVIYDRIRENNKMHLKQEFPLLVNTSIRQTLARTINTVVAILILLICLNLFGGETTKLFAFALIVGSTIGAYTSIFIAGSLLVDITNKMEHNKKNKASERAKANLKTNRKPVPVKK